MRLTIIVCMLWISIHFTAMGAVADSVKYQTIEEVVVVGNAQQLKRDSSPLAIEVVDTKSITENFTGNFMQALEYIPGVQSMSVGSGFSKPMIRGMGFNRVTVIDDGVKQQGQQWGADHGLEIDAFDVDRVNVTKGSSSLLYGSDAMGGVIEVLKPIVPFEDGFSGSIDILGRSVNGLIGGSLMLDYKHGDWYVKARHSAQYFGDFAVPTDTIVYLSQKIPLVDRHISNSAGHEHATSLYSCYRSRNYATSLSASNIYQKVGFFPGAHGIPDPDRVFDDGSLRDIDLPYSWVNHIKAAWENSYSWERIKATWTLSYQNNHREEWSLFHTHYTTQTPPAIDPNKEIELVLNNYNSNFKLNFIHTNSIKSALSWDAAYQTNRIGGYSFLLPNYNLFTTGLAWVTTYRASDKLTLSGGVRYDYGHINSEGYVDYYLKEYLQSLNYSQEVIDANIVRSYPLDRGFGDYSLSAGGVWSINRENSLHFNIGRSFRLPNANELAANGVHHSSFRHEQGDPTLDSERGWQLDLAYNLNNRYISVNLSPYASWYSSYIYAQPSKQWSILPHAGQIYRYTQCEALFAGGELSVEIPLPANFKYNLGAEYTYTYNIDENIPIAFSPPTTIRNVLSWSYSVAELSFEWLMVAAQNRVDRNEDPTPGAQLFGAKAIFQLPFISNGATAVISVDNIFDTKYLNHLSFYRSVEIPEPGRNIQLSIKIPINKNK